MKQKNTTDLGMEHENKNQGHQETLPKEQRTRGLSSSCQRNYLKSYQKIKHKSYHISSSESRLSINKKSQPNISISTKLKIQNLDQT